MPTTFVKFGLADLRQFLRILWVTFRWVGGYADQQCRFLQDTSALDFSKLSNDLWVGILF